MNIQNSKVSDAANEISALEEQLATQARFNTLLTEENGSLMSKNKHLEGMVATNQKRDELGREWDDSELVEYRELYQQMREQLSDTTQTILTLSRENAKLKEIINTYSLDVLAEHNYA